MNNDKEDLTMIKLPDGKIINKKSNEINLKPDCCKEAKNYVPPIH